MKKVMSPEFRVSFPNVFEPKGFEGGDAKYNLAMLFPKDADLSEMKALAQEALIARWPDDAKRKQVTSHPSFKSPFRDGDLEKPDLDGYPGHIFVTASSKMRPGIVDQNINPIMDQGDFYAGAYGRATLTAYAFEKAGNRGVAFGLQNLMKTRDGDSFSGRAKAEDDFAAYKNSAKAETDDGMFN
jgi:hypothetical protein